MAKSTVRTPTDLGTTVHEIDKEQARINERLAGIARLQSSTASDVKEIKGKLESLLIGVKGLETKLNEQTEARKLRMTMWFSAGGLLVSGVSVLIALRNTVLGH